MQVTITYKTPNGAEYIKTSERNFIHSEEDAKRLFPVGRVNPYTGCEIVNVECSRYYRHERPFVGAPLVRERY